MSKLRSSVTGRDSACSRVGWMRARAGEQQCAASSSAVSAAAAEGAIRDHFPLVQAAGPTQRWRGGADVSGGRAAPARAQREEASHFPPRLPRRELQRCNGRAPPHFRRCAGEGASHTGEHFQVDACAVDPRPSAPSTRPAAATGGDWRRQARACPRSRRARACTHATPPAAQLAVQPQVVTRGRWPSTHSDGQQTRGTGAHARRQLPPRRCGDEYAAGADPTGVTFLVVARLALAVVTSETFQQPSNGPTSLGCRGPGRASCSRPPRGRRAGRR